MNSDLAEAHQRCMTQYDSLVDLPLNEAHLLEPVRGLLLKVQNERNRYAIWAVNAGAGHSGVDYKRSLDYRLRLAETYRVQVLRILARIEELVTEFRTLAEPLSVTKSPNALHVTLDQEASNKSHQPPLDDSEHSSDSDDDPTLQAWGSTTSDVADNGTQPPGHTAQEPTDLVTPFLARQNSTDNVASALENVCASLRLAVTFLYKIPLRLPVPMARLKDLPKGPDHDLMEQYEFVDRNHVRDAFPLADSRLSLRLASAITQRRRLLKYRETRSQRLKAISVSGPPEDGESVTATTLRPPTNLPNDLHSFEVEPSEAGTISTTATSVQVDKLHLPKRPRNETGELIEDFECSCCYRAVHVGVRDRAWKKHIFSDLEAYQCTAIDCSTGNATFYSKEEWKKHQQQHLYVFKCGTGDHGTFTEEKMFATHLAELHGIKLPSPISPESLAFFHRAVPRASSAQCPLCKQQSRSITAHIAAHLERLALFALPSHVLADSSDSESDEDAESREDIAVAESASAQYSRSSHDRVGGDAEGPISRPPDNSEGEVRAADFQDLEPAEAQIEEIGSRSGGFNPDWRQRFEEWSRDSDHRPPAQVHVAHDHRATSRLVNSSLPFNTGPMRQPRSTERVRPPAHRTLSPTETNTSWDSVQRPSFSSPPQSPISPAMRRSSGYEVVESAAPQHAEKQVEMVASHSRATIDEHAAENTTDPRGAKDNIGITDCPYCGAGPYTTFSKQCRDCGRFLTHSNSQHVAPLADPESPLGKVQALARTFANEWLPSAGAFLSAPAPDPDAREKEYLRLSGHITTWLFHELDQIDTEGDFEARNERKLLANRAHDVLKRLEIVRNEGRPSTPQRVRDAKGLEADLEKTVKASPSKEGRQLAYGQTAPLAFTSPPASPPRKTAFTADDEKRLRAEKRADIERRCQTIDPPIRPSTLPFMEAYNVAIQSMWPLHESSWDTLKHRLIAQRQEAEQRELDAARNQQSQRLGDSYVPPPKALPTRHSERSSDSEESERKDRRRRRRRPLVQFEDDEYPVVAPPSTPPSGQRDSGVFSGDVSYPERGVKYYDSKGRLLAPTEPRNNSIRELTQQFNKIITDQELDKLEAEARAKSLQEKLNEAQASIEQDKRESWLNQRERQLLDREQGYRDNQSYDDPATKALVRTRAVWRERRRLGDGGKMREQRTSDAGQSNPNDPLEVGSSAREEQQQLDHTAAVAQDAQKPSPATEVPSTTSQQEPSTQRPAAAHRSNTAKRLQPRPEKPPLYCTGCSNGPYSSYTLGCPRCGGVLEAASEETHGGDLSSAATDEQLQHKPNAAALRDASTVEQDPGVKSSRAAYDPAAHGFVEPPWVHSSQSTMNTPWHAPRQSINSSRRLSPEREDQTSQETYLSQRLEDRSDTSGGCGRPLAGGNIGPVGKVKYCTYCFGGPYPSWQKICQSSG